MRLLAIVLPVLLFFTLTSQAQVLSGRVLRESGMAASGVTVKFLNKANSISTNADGTFRITATHLPDTLVFSAPGYEPYRVVITEKNIKDPSFEVVLLNERKELDEVMVFAYGTARKKDVTGSVSTVSGYTDLSGRVAGVDVGSGSTAPIRIRGASSITVSNNPLVRGYYVSDSMPGRSGSMAKSRILTAGEVNDFLKWKMWEDFSEGEFKSYRSSWGMNTTHRYSVQLTGSQKQAVVNAPVFLLNRTTGDTVWTAVTDNTGKAELWSGFIEGSPANDNLQIRDGRGHILNHPSEFAQGMNLLQTDQACDVSRDVDIAFMVDATGSMGDEIEFLKLELEDVIRSTMEKYASLNLRAASVFYRDLADEYVVKQNDFNDDLLKTLNFIKLQNAAGGGDGPEAVDLAVQEALDSLHWNSAARTRLLFMVLDAPPHAGATARMQELTRQAARQGIRLIPVACSGTDKSTEFLMRSMALATNGTYAFLTNHSGVGGSHIEPTTDKYQVELLNGLLQRLISQFLYAADCSEPAIAQASNQPANVLSVKVYPNPSTGRFTLESKKDIREMFITDFTGKILQRLGDANRKGRWQVDLGAYPSGMYFAKYITADNTWGSEKLLVMR